MLHSFLFLTLFVFGGLNNSQPEKDSRTENRSAAHWENEVLEVKFLNDSISLHYVNNSNLFSEGWDRLAQPAFWKKIMLLSPDSCVINVAKSREIVAQFSVEEWNTKSETEKDAYRDKIREERGLTANDKIYMTTGKSDFYAFDLVIPSISKGVQVFNDKGVDPWYAQAILLIESPGKIARSNVGAYGPFQLMPSVARSHGLRVDKYVDERKDFVRSAEGAASLIQNTCLPHARRLLDEHALEYSESDLWFRLFVLHIYHAGASNVNAVLNAIQPKQGGNELIHQMWQTSAAKFKNASQNYSQLALAASIILEEILLKSGDFSIVESRVE